MSPSELEEYIEKEIMENPLLIDNNDGHQADSSAIIENIPSVNNPLEEIYLDINCKDIDESDKNIAHIIVNSLDDHGFLSSSLDEISNSFNLSVEDVYSVRDKIVTKLDPPGMGMSDVVDYLIFQLGDSSIDCVLKDILVNNRESFLELKNDSIYGDDVFNDAIARLRELKLCPIVGLSLPCVDFIYHEVIFEVNDGDISIRVRGMRDSLSVSTEFDGALDNEFISLRKATARNIVSSLTQRNRTLYSLSEVLAKYQKSFIIHGQSAIKPLSFKDVAIEMGVHESTVSRAVSGKYALLPGGLIPLRSFFTSSVKCSTGDVPIGVVKNKISQLILSEGDNKLSDQKICDILNNQGISIARRTISKYREEMGILSKRIR